MFTSIIKGIERTRVGVRSHGKNKRSDWTCFDPELSLGPPFIRANRMLQAESDRAYKPENAMTSLSQQQPHMQGPLNNTHICTCELCS